MSWSVSPQFVANSGVNGKQNAYDADAYSQFGQNTAYYDLACFYLPKTEHHGVTEWEQNAVAPGAWKFRVVR